MTERTPEHKKYSGATMDENSSYARREWVFCGMRIAEYGKLSTGNLRKIRCGFFSAE